MASSTPATGKPAPAMASAPIQRGTFSSTDERQVKFSVESYQLFVTFVLSVSVFGASTFAVVVSQMADPADVWAPQKAPYSLATVRNFLAAAWLCFVLAIAVAGYSLSVLYLHLQHAGPDGRWLRTWRMQGIVGSVLLHSLLVVAFLFLALALVAYVGVVGWVAVGFCCLAGCFVVVLSVLQWRQIPRRH